MLRTYSMMMNYLTDIMLIQDLTFALQLLCIMKKKPALELMNELDNYLRLKDLYAFDNNFTFYSFDRIYFDNLEYKTPPRDQ